MTRPSRGWDWRRPGNRANRAELVEAVRAAAAEELEGSSQILEIGCASGWLLRALGDEIAPNRINGVDLDEQRIRAAADSLPGAKFVTADARQLPYPAGRFGVVILASLLSTLSREDAELVMTEARRVLASDGVLLVYDVRPGP